MLEPTEMLIVAHLSIKAEPFFNNSMNGIMSSAISVVKLQIWFTNPKNDRTSVCDVGIGKFFKASVRAG